MTLPISQTTALGIGGEGSALPRLKPRIGLVDDVDDALAAHELAVAVTRLERLERASDLHALISGARTMASGGFVGSARIYGKGVAKSMSRRTSLRTSLVSHVCIPDLKHP